MTVAAAFIFLIQEVVIPFIILSCFLFKTFFASRVCTFPLSRWSSILCVCFLKPFVHWWKLLACCCSLTKDRLLSLQWPFHPQRRFQSGEGCWARLRGSDVHRQFEGRTDWVKFRSTCFRVFSSGHGFKCGFHRQRLEVVLSEGYLFTCSHRTFLVHFARTWIHVTQKMLSLLQGAVRVKCFLTGVVGLQNNQKNSFATSLTLSNPNCLPPPHWPWLRQEIILHAKEWHALDSHTIN